MPYMSDVLVTHEPGHPPSMEPIDRSDAYHRIRDQNSMTSVRAEQIEALPLDTLPDTRFVTTKRKSIPALFRFYSHLIASAAFMEVMEDFDVGDLTRHPVNIFGKGGMEFGQFFDIHVVETKDSIDYDRSDVRLDVPEPAIYSCNWIRPAGEISDGLFARPEAAEGVDLWVERRMYSRGVLFSDALWAALSDAKIKCFSSKFFRIDIVDAGADNSKGSD